MANFDYISGANSMGEKSEYMYVYVCACVRMPPLTPPPSSTHIYALTQLQFK